MQASIRKSPQHGHVVVLSKRAICASQSLKIGSKKDYYIHSCGSPPSHSGVFNQISNLPSPRGSPKHTHKHIRESYEGETLLGCFGVDSYLGRMVIRFLMFLMFFQPIYVALGMELEGETLPLVVEEISAQDDVNEVGDQLSDVTESIDQEELQIETGFENNEEGVENGNNNDLENIEAEYVFDEGDETKSELDEDGVIDDVVTTTDTGDEDALNNEDDDIVSDTEESEHEGNDIASSTDEDVIATSTEEVETEKVVVTENNDNKYVFNEGDCTLVSEGEFYCVADGPERQTDGDPRVYAQKDREGDKEIYYFDGVEIHRITNNSYDDFAPVFDDETMRIVWQAMIQDRLQVMLHDITTNTTRQVTNGRQNSSNPNITRDTIVWQEWVDTNWEIMMTTVPDEGEVFDIERLTDNMVHDMFPAMYDDLLTWQSERGSSWEVVLYDLVTKKRHTLEKNEDTKYENPRFALLFDSQHENGDTETIGYDLETGEKMELGTKANPQPIIPVTPKQEVPEAIPQTVSSTMNKVSKEDVDPSEPTLE